MSKSLTVLSFVYQWICYRSIPAIILMIIDDPAGAALPGAGVLRRDDAPCKSG